MSFALLPNYANQQRQQKIQRIYIDPENLVQLKKNKKAALKMVPSIFQPPQQIEEKNSQQTNVTSLKNTSLINKLSLNRQRNSKNLQIVELSSSQKLKKLYQTLGYQNVNPHIQFIWKIIPSYHNKQIILYEQGDLIHLNLESQRFLILQGQIKIIGYNNHNYIMKQGYLFFLSNQTKQKIKQIIVLKSTKVLKITNILYNSYIKNYLYLKNSQKIKFIKYCPFFIWKDQLTEDLAACIEMKYSQKQQVIYPAGSIPNSIYFVKEGIVLLQRNNKIINPIFNDYEMHYEKNQITQKDAILVVRKGMAFGLDGIIIKEMFDPSQLNKSNVSSNFSQLYQQNNLFQRQDQFNPENQILRNQLKRKITRIYTAKTLGKCQIYVLNRKVLQTLFSVSDINQKQYQNKKNISSQQLQRMSIQYTNMLLNQSYGVPLPVNLKKKNLQLKISQQQQSKQNRLSHGHLKVLMQNHLHKNKIAQKLRQKRSNSHQNFKNQLYLQECKIQNQLKNKIQNIRKIQESKRMKKFNSQQKLNSNYSQPIQNDLFLPRLSENNILLINKKNNHHKQNEQNKIQEIIQLKIKQQLVQFNSKNKNLNNTFNNSNKIKLKQNKKQLKQFKNQDKKSCDFMNIKSYKSIITSYENKK